ncbi:MAG: hypothetical protein Q9157_001339 [Trypethelium eluteriae]
MGEINEIEYQIENLERSIHRWEIVIRKIEHLESLKVFLIELVEAKKAQVQRRRKRIQEIQSGNTEPRKKAFAIAPAIPVKLEHIPATVAIPHGDDQMATKELVEVDDPGGEQRDEAISFEVFKTPSR